jgi:hypothetical protein
LKRVIFHPGDNREKTMKQLNNRFLLKTSWIKFEISRFLFEDLCNFGGGLDYYEKKEKNV